MEGDEVSKEPGNDFDQLIQTPCNDSLVFSEKEKAILELWDAEEELRLEQGLLEAQSHVQAPETSTVSDDQLDAQLKVAELEALEARANYVLRNRIIQHVLITDPVLKAVHKGTDGNVLEQKLLPLINERDILTMVSSTLSKDLSNAMNSLSASEIENMQVVAKNQELATVMLALAEETKAQDAHDIADTDLRNQLDDLDAQVRVARRDWRIMKSVVSGVVAGSGLNWAKDEKLRELVLDDEDEVG
ncbi:hypothetical protein NA57DRAFT_77885 [Rhizodiscina lignyota]|uniref:Centromere protein H C-terminal domain-containing protein n=1 Tax=Rhizodiscina lignyota TaxID=1504668 RepID=A0A9P4M7T3_9PEZI|nr:hypothetical protein NA57DRAFT_77885 [Rhizodiscina lignyota]